MYARKPVRRATIAVLSSLAAAFCTAAPAGAISSNEWQSPTAPLPIAKLVANDAALDSQVLQNFMSDRVAGRYYQNGVWRNPDTQCWECLDGAAAAAAVLYRYQGSTNSHLYSTAVGTFNHVVADEQAADGSFAASPEQNAGISTEFLLQEFGLTYLELKSALPMSTRTAWQHSIASATNYLVASGDTTWYANGNIQLRLSEDLWLAWQVTGDTAYETAYRAELQFSLSPPQGRWPGFGLQITKAPTMANGSDGSGYLAESGGGAPGFDPWYTDVQLDTATQMWVLTGGTQWLRLTNLFMNQLRSRVNSTWTLNATGGTRKSYLIPFYSSTPQVLYAKGVRPDLALGAAVQQWRLIWEMTNTDLYSNPNYYSGLASWVSTLLLALQPGPGPSSSASASPSVRPGPNLRTSPATPDALQRGRFTVTVSRLQSASSFTLSVTGSTRHGQRLILHLRRVLRPAHRSTTVRIRVRRLGRTELAANARLTITVSVRSRSGSRTARTLSIRVR